MAYISEDTVELKDLERLPLLVTLKDGTKAEIVQASAEDDQMAIMHDMMNEVILAGTTYPYIKQMTLDQFKAYFLSHTALKCRHKDTGEVLGMFYIKPNFPGRASHICNAGFVVKTTARGNGVCRKMAEAFLVLAQDLGYRASMFNLVYVTNEASVHLWRSMGFKETGRVPNAGNLKGLGYTDAIQFYYDLVDAKLTPPS